MEFLGGLNCIGGWRGGLDQNPTDLLGERAFSERSTALYNKLRE